MSEHTPGRQLDRLVAEQVMGWPRAYDAETGEYYGIAGVPHYSTDIAAAWEVVGHLSRGPYSVTVNSYGAHTGYVRIERAGRATVVATGQSITTPHAICLAALAVVEKARSE